MLMAQLTISTTEVLLRAGTEMSAAAPATANSAVTLPPSEPVESGGFATFRVGETTSSLRCAQLQRGWREPHALVIRTGTDIASADFISRLNGLRDGTAAIVATAARLQQSAATTAVQSSADAGRGVATPKSTSVDQTIGESAEAAAGQSAPVISCRLPAPSPATAAAYPVSEPPDTAAATAPVQAAHRPGFKRGARLEDGGRVLLQARLHIAAATAELTQGPRLAAPLLRATVAATDIIGASPGLPTATRSSSAAATPQASEAIPEHEGAPRQPAKTPTSASVWLQRTNDGAANGGLIAVIPWQVSVASVIAEVAAAESGDSSKAGDGSCLSGRSGSRAKTNMLPAEAEQCSVLRQLLSVGQLTAEMIVAAQQQPSVETSAPLQLQGEH